MKKASILFAIAILALAGCTANKSAQTAPAASTTAQSPLSGNWIMTAYEVGGGTAQFDPTTEYSLQFNPEDKAFGITTDCNSILGSYTVGRGDTIRFSNLGMTRMACPNPVVEQAVLGILNDPEAYAIYSGNTLRISSRTGQAFFTRSQLP